MHALGPLCRFSKHARQQAQVKAQVKAQVRPKLKPKTGMQYSVEVSFELARRLSAASHKSASNLDHKLNCSSAIFALG